MKIESFQLLALGLNFFLVSFGCCGPVIEIDEKQVGTMLDKRLWFVEELPR